MRKVRMVLLVVILSVFAIFATGCQKEEEQVGLTFSGWSIGEAGSKATLEAMVADYNAVAKENNKVSTIVWPWADTVTQFSQRYQGTEQFDVAQIDIRMLAPLAEAGFLADLTPLFTQQYLNANFDEANLKVGQYNGVQYGVPWTIAPIGMISNPKILADSGVDFDIVTIADFERALGMVKNNHPNNLDSDLTNDITPYAAMTKDAGTTTPDFLPWLWTFGGQVFNGSDVVIDSPQAKEAFTWFKSLKDQGFISEGMGRSDARTLFKEGRVAFYDDAILGKSSISNAENGSIETYAKPILRPVKNVSDSPKALSWGHLLVIINRSPKKDVAVDLIKHIVSEQQALRYFNSNGMLPSVKSVLAKETVTNDYWANSWKPIINGGRLSEFSTGAKEGTYNSIVTEEIQAILSGSKSVDAATASMKTRIKNA